jgi:hypothetical protein
MSGWFLTNYNRSRVLTEIAAAALGSRVTLDDGPQRTNPQNRLMWKLLSYFADQVVHGDRKYDADTWKCILLKAFGKELAFVPALDGTSVVALGYRSSLLGVDEMSQFIEFIYEQGGNIGVVFNDELPEAPMIYLPTCQKAIPA